MFKSLPIIFSLIFLTGCGGNLQNILDSTKPHVEISSNAEASVVCSGLVLASIPLEICYVGTETSKEICIRASFLKYCVDI